MTLSKLVKRRSFVFAAAAATSIGGAIALAQRATAPQETASFPTPYVVPTIAALKALTVRPLVVVTQGYTSANDGGGGPPWIWVADSAVAADDFLVVQPPRGPAGRYFRIIERGATVSPKWAGAGLGDVDDTTRMNIVLAAPGAHAVDISGCNLPGTAFRVPENATCPGIFSDGSGKITVAPRTNEGYFIFTVFKSEFFVDRIFFDGPISRTPRVPPPCASLLSLENPGYETDRHRITNCRFRGGSSGFQARNINGNGFLWFQDNIVSDTWGDATAIHCPKNCVFSGNMVYSCGYDPGATDSACHFTTIFSINPVENLIVTNNIIRDCCIGFNQEAIDIAGNLIRNAIFANNILDRVTYGGFEFKSQTSAAAPDFYGDILIANNIVNFVPGGYGAGVALNPNGTPDQKMTRFKIIGNQFICDSSGCPAHGVSVGAFDNVEVTGNMFNNIGIGVYVNAAGAPSETASNIIVQGNSINTLRHGINFPGRRISRVAVQNNHVTSGQEAFRCDGTVNNLVCTGNHFETLSNGYAAVNVRDIQIGKFAYNTLVGTSGGLTIGGKASTNVRIVNNDVTAATRDAFVVNTGVSVLISNNDCNIAASSRIVSGAGTYSSVNNSRGAAPSDPTGTLAGSIGDIVWNTIPAAGGVRGWICTTAGGIGVAIYKGMSISQ